MHRTTLTTDRYGIYAVTLYVRRSFYKWRWWSHVKTYRRSNYHDAVRVEGMLRRIK